MNQLTQYIIALSNLYGMIHKDKLIEIYNSQNEDQIGLIDVEELIANPPEELEAAFVLTHNNYFLIETIIENDEFDLMLRKKADKPFYIPAKDELLKYVDGNYFEKSKQYKALLSYLKKNFFKSGDEKAEWLAEDIQGMCQFGVDMQTIFDSFNNMEISFKDLDQANEVMKLITELSNNIRIWENNGYTPQEIFELGGSKIIDMKTRQKIGRNEPCPCGSGKKYKKCCLVKDE